jgi:dynein heavy chain
MEEFAPEAVAKVSKACTSICMWVRAMYVYHNVALQVSGWRWGLMAGCIRVRQPFIPPA